MLFPHLIIYRISAGLYHELQPAGIRVTAVRAGQMYEPGKPNTMDAQAVARFMQPARAVGLNLRARGVTHVDSVTDVFRCLLDMQADLAALVVHLQARRDVN